MRIPIFKKNKKHRSALTSTKRFNRVINIFIEIHTKYVHFSKLYACEIYERFTRKLQFLGYFYLSYFLTYFENFIIENIHTM